MSVLRHLVGMTFVLTILFLLSSALALTVISSGDETTSAYYDTAENEIFADDEVVNGDYAAVLEKYSREISKGRIINVRLRGLERLVIPFNITHRFPFYLSGYDDEDRPIWVFEFGKFDLRSIVEGGEATIAAFDMHMNQAIYRIYRSLVDKSLEAGTGIWQINVLWDNEGFNLYQFAHLPTLTHSLNLIRKYHALADRHLRLAVFFNVNFVAERFITAIRPVLGGVAERIEVYGTNKNQWIPVLRRRFPQDQIPSWYGGKKGFTPLLVYG